MAYTDRIGGYPRVWVSDYKHANYRNDRECDRGGTFGSDQCDADTTFRPSTLDHLNIGSYTTMLVDSVQSTNPLYAGVWESYWTPNRFTGWQGWQPDSDHYRKHLDAAGFGLPNLRTF